MRADRLTCAVLLLLATSIVAAACHEPPEKSTSNPPVVPLLEAALEDCRPLHGAGPFEQMMIQGGRPPKDGGDAGRVCAVTGFPRTYRVEFVANAPGKCGAPAPTSIIAPLPGSPPVIILERRDADLAKSYCGLSGSVPPVSAVVHVTTETPELIRVFHRDAPVVSDRPTDPQFPSESHSYDGDAEADFLTITRAIAACSEARGDGPFGSPAPCLDIGYLRRGTVLRTDPEVWATDLGYALRVDLPGSRLALLEEHRFNGAVLRYYCRGRTLLEAASPPDAGTDDRRAGAPALSCYPPPSGRASP